MLIIELVKGEKSDKRHLKNKNKPENNDFLPLGDFVPRAETLHQCSVTRHFCERWLTLLQRSQNIAWSPEYWASAVNSLQHGKDLNRTNSKQKNG